MSFDEERIISKLSVTFQIDEQIKLGRTISGSTLDWWMDQSRVAQQALFSPAVINQRLRPIDALDQIHFFVRDADEVWGNGAAFDNVILTDAFRSMKGLTAWGFSKDRCYRTVKALNSNIKEEAFIGTKHNALDDAVHQVLHLQKIWRETASANSGITEGVQA